MNLVFHPERYDHSQLAGEVLDSNPVLYSKISIACKIEESQVLPILTEVIRFLNLIAVAEMVLTPSKSIDDAWHEFILCTKAYWSFCEDKFGRMIHHHPGGSKEKNRDQFGKTLEFYHEFFGPPDPRFWENEVTSLLSECGSCESDKA